LSYLDEHDFELLVSSLIEIQKMLYTFNKEFESDE